MKNIGTFKSHICKSCSLLVNNSQEHIPQICLSCTKKDSILEDIIAMDFFHLFNIKPSFVVDRNFIFREYRSLQKLVHPDLIISLQDKEAIKEAERASSIISKSYQILLNDYERAKYIVSN